MEFIRLYLLGSPRVERAGNRIEFDTRKAVALLAYLAVSPRPHQRDTIAALLWPEADQSGARAALRRTLSVLRSGLGSDALTIARDSIAWPSTGPLICDVEEFLQLTGQVNRHHDSPKNLCDQCRQDLEHAAALYQDHFMAGFSLRDSLAYDDWQFEQSEDFRRRLAFVLDELVGAYIQRGEFDPAIRHARRWLGLDPLQEAAHCQLMLSLAWSNQRNAALQQYRECVRILERELGVSPLDETTQLYQAILENSLPAMPSASAKGEYPNRTAYSAADISDSHLIKLDAIDHDKPAHLHFPLVGRSSESQALLEAFAETGQNAHWLMVSGEPGIGKTRLVEDFLESARRRGAKTLTGRCYPRENDLAFAPFIEAMRSGLLEMETQRLSEIAPPSILSEVGRIIPELFYRIPQISPANPLTGSGEQSVFFESVHQMLTCLLAGDLPGVLFLDDFHWADSASIHLFSYLIRRHQGSPLLFLTSCRNYDLPEGLRSLEHEVQRRGNYTSLHLGRLAPVYISELAQYSLNKSRPGLEPNAQKILLERLFTETEGLPFFITEYLRALTLQPLAGLNQPGSLSLANWPIPSGVQELIKARLANLDETAWQILTTAAVIGRSFDLDTLQEASGRSDFETLHGIEQLLREHLIEEIHFVEQSLKIQYDFTHDKLRQLVYDQTNAARKRLLHRRVAEAQYKQARLAGLLGQSAPSIAYHYQQGGLEARAAEFYKLAGDSARQVFALLESIHHYQSALAMGYSQSAQLHEKIGEIYIYLGEYPAALRYLQSAASSAAGADLARIEQAIGNLHHRRGEWELAFSHFEAAEKIIGSQSASSQLASLYADWARTLQRTGNSEHAIRISQKSLELARKANDQESQAKAENILGMIARIQGNYELAEQFLQSSLGIAIHIQDLSIQVAALNNLALLYQNQGQLAKSIQLTRQALESCQKMGDRHRQAALLNHLADLYHQTGQEEQAMDHLKQAVVIFSEIGKQADSQLPEIWMLTEW